MDGPVVALTVLIAYDVSSDSRRSQLAARLQAWGDRIQKSVFVCLVDSDDLDRLWASATALVDPDVDAMHLVPICGACREDVRQVGQAQLEPPPAYWLV